MLRVASAAGPAALCARSLEACATARWRRTSTMTSTTALFVDTWDWLTLRDRRERRHREAKAAFQEALSRKSGLVTTDFVLDETFTLLFRRLPLPASWNVPANWGRVFIGTGKLIPGPAS